jgi:hypothetical protein
MRTRKLFSALAILLFLIFPASSRGGDFIAFEKRVVDLESAMKNPNFAIRFSVFLNARKELKQIKDRGKRDLEPGELSMALFLETLSDFPMKPISIAECKKIEENAQTMNRSSPEENEENAYLLRAKNIVSMLCK